ncbi:hypothetical protein D3C77_372130 [compost metagenome]
MNWNCPKSLYSIYMKCSFSVSAANYFSNFHDRLQRADLIIAIHNTDQNGIRTERLGDLLRMDTTSSIHRKICYLKPCPLQLLTRMQHRMVFYCCRNNVLALRFFSLHRTEYRQIIALCAASRKYKLLRLAA